MVDLERLQYLASSAAERLSDYQRLNEFVKFGLEAVDEIRRLRIELRDWQDSSEEYRKDLEALRTLSPPEPTEGCLAGVNECLTTLCEWFSQREAGTPTTNSEAAMFERVNYVASQIDAACGLSFEAHKIMTPEEYAATPVKGWHSVHRDYDGFGATAIRYDDPVPRSMPLQEDGWQRISTAPKNSKDLLLCVAGFSPLTGHWNESTGCWVSHPDHTSYEPTHWMPIRAVPAMVAEQETK